MAKSSPNEVFTEVLKSWKDVERFFFFTFSSFLTFSSTVVPFSGSHRRCRSRHITTKSTTISTTQSSITSSPTATSFRTMTSSSGVTTSSATSMTTTWTMTSQSTSSTHLCVWKSETRFVFQFLHQMSIVEPSALDGSTGPRSKASSFSYLKKTTAI